ncbi:MAG: hypothetical protein ABEJ99_01330 [Candidatus Nanohaloarchaea archaeon]
MSKAGPVLRVSFIFAALLLATALASAQSFGSTSDPLPNVTNISVYDVTGLSTSGKDTAGKLVDYGLNTTFRIDQKSSNKEYRVQFKIVNDGNQAWNINGSDEMYHAGLNSTWTVNKIWYNTSQSLNGGTFQNGRVTWDTGNGGTVSPGGTMYAKYLVTPSLPDSQFFNLNFTVNHTSNDSGSYDLHDLDINKLGYLNMTINDPPNDTVLTQNKTFVMNASITCLDGECGKVDGYPRYNKSAATADTMIPSGSGTPFYTETQSTQECSPDLLKGDTCTMSWSVNATGALSSYHLLDIRANSSYSKISGNDTEDHLAQINMAILINVTWNTVDFGVLNPGTTDQPAQNNSDLLYNVSVPQESNTVDDLWIRSTNLTSDQGWNYNISAVNVSHSFTNDPATALNLSNSFTHIKSNISPGDVLTNFFWLDVPKGIYKGGYSGSIYFKGNSTR